MQRYLIHNCTHNNVMTVSRTVVIRKFAPPRIWLKVPVYDGNYKYRQKFLFTTYASFYVFCIFLLFDFFSFLFHLTIPMWSTFCRIYINHPHRREHNIQVKEYYVPLNLCREHVAVIFQAKTKILWYCTVVCIRTLLKSSKKWHTVH